MSTSPHQSTAKARVGMIGCGAISGAYLGTLPRLRNLDLVAVADLDPERAKAAATSYPGARALGVDELLAEPEIDLVLNLTIPAAHAEIAEAAIAAGKSVYGEKPLTANVDEARRMLAAADAAGVRIGCAPDTVLGTGTQTARAAIDAGLIGAPIAATATMVTPGHERWHPNPDFYYQPGGGPLLDMGPYYLTSLITLLGDVSSVIGAGSRTRDTRTIGRGPRAGEQIGVTVDSHVTGVLTHTSGVLSTLVMSFDSVASHAARIEVHGEVASLTVPDPNRFDGDVELRGLDDKDWRRLDESAGYRNASRGYGLADLVATPAGDEPRAGGRLAYHVLEVMESLLASAASGQRVDIESRVERPPVVPLGDGPFVG
jgi:predicted dehydrogenase